MMTRLTSDMIKDLPDSITAIDRMLMRTCSMDLRHLACCAAGMPITDFSDYKAVSVPITSGLGTISGFSQSTAKTASDMGLKSTIASVPDVNGFAEALNSNADVILMADDERFMSFGTASGRYADNSYCTAAGYVTALESAAGGLGSEEVLILGAGKVGSIMATLVADAGCDILLADVDLFKAQKVASSLEKTSVTSNIRDAIASHRLILNASPAPIDNSLITDGAVISTPGVPYPIDKNTEDRATVIFDPLAIGTAVMIAQCLSFSIEKGV